MALSAQDTPYALLYALCAEKDLMFVGLRLVIDQENQHIAVAAVLEKT